MLLELAPGLRVVRRGPSHLQVGLYDEHRLVLPRTRTTLDVLDRITRREPVDLAEPGAAPIVRQLLATGCVAPLGAPEQARLRRGRARVAVLGDLGAAAGGPDDPPALTDVPALLEAAGLAAPLTSAASAEVAVVLACGEPDRGRFDGFLRSGLPHLVVRAVDAGIVLGPFVVPGSSACLRCVDAHRTRADPDHSSVLARYAAATSSPRGDGADRVDPVLVQVGLACAVRDLVVHLDGGRPSTWSATVRLGPEPARHEHVTWPQHPECGCCWPGVVVA